ncbi:MAG TPA: hypothetical protein VLQ91_17995 [Draconibacterium sp.]|nr:hypothetical protein [Draconibacterium sp.]
MIRNLKISMIATVAGQIQVGYLQDVYNATSGNVQLGKIWKAAHFVPIIPVIS